MILQAHNLSPEQRAAAELLLGRPLEERESVSVQAFELPPIPEDRRREVSFKLRKLFAEVDLNLRPATSEETEEILIEAIGSSGLDTARTGEDHP